MQGNKDDGDDDIEDDGDDDDDDDDDDADGDDDDDDDDDDTIILGFGLKNFCSIRSKIRVMTVMAMKKIIQSMIEMRM
ncbi:hypothetical protein ElyMa_006484700 [Elysia marginata]|uniref:Uncharacterized protein n=1 Tax=Elysia marginata TaxID=1093978 RepID=A0AAV4I0K3_9GAST|nr:hypothetical protein ElyMa_006484700 [Elysia marginata]